MKKVISILIVLMVSASLFASGYIGIKTGAEMTFGSIYGMTVFSNESEPTSPNMGRYDFQKYFWNVGISGANFFTNDRHHNFGLGYGIDFGFRMSTHSSLVLPENSSGLDAIGGILSNIYNAIIIEEVDVIYSPYIGAQYQYKSSDFLSIDASCGLGVQLGMAKFQASDTAVVESFYHSVYMYLDYTSGRVANKGRRGFCFTFLLWTICRLKLIYGKIEYTQLGGGNSDKTLPRTSLRILIDITSGSSSRMFFLSYVFLSA